MGAIAQQAQQRQLTTQPSPAKQLQQVLQRSWDRIAAVMPREMNEQRLYQMFVSAINREPKLAECTVESVLSCFMRGRMKDVVHWNWLRWRLRIRACTSILRIAVPWMRWRK